MVEENKLIAEFMGYEVSESNPTKFIDTRYVVTRESHMKFHSCWNELMSVVEKIRGLSFIVEQGNRLTDDFKLRYFVDIRHAIKRSVYESTIFGDNDLKLLTYEAVIEFIEWYNENNSK